MTDMHPYWQSTDDERPVHISSVQKNKEQDPQMIHSTSSPVAASRKPAAIAGIAIFLVIGFFWMGGLSSVTSLLGQTSSSVTVTITSSGTNPETVTVQPGTTITWTNNDTIPHVLTSDTLPTSDGQPFMTSAIFPGASTHILIPQNAADGTYAYISKTAQNISGHIVIAGAAVSTTSAAPVDTTSMASTPSVPIPQVPSPVANSSASSAPDMTGASAPPLPSSEMPVAPAPTASVLPSNPHTVGTEQTLPGGQTSSTGVTSDIHPVSEPATGPDIWIVVAASMIGLLWISRKALRIV